MTSRDTSADHARHDQLLIAAIAAGDLPPAEQRRAETQLADCSLCAELARDIRSIAAATTAQALPTPQRPRSFTLRPEEAARLRPTGWRGFIRRFGDTGLAFTRPLAAGLTTLGLATLLVSTLPAGLVGGAASAPAPQSAAREETGDRGLMEGYSTDGASPAPSAAAAPAAPSAAPSADVEPASGGGHGLSGVPTPSPGAKGSDVPTPSPTTNRLGGLSDDAATPGGTDLGADDGSGPPIQVIAGWAFVALGLGLFALRWAGRRLA